jgi:hypothetical protein
MLETFHRVTYGAAFGGRPFSFSFEVVEDEPKCSGARTNIGTISSPDGGLLGTTILGERAIHCSPPAVAR